ncbi:unnamed protein product [Alopecurus aequalis]
MGATHENSSVPQESSWANNCCVCLLLSATAIFLVSSLATLIYFAEQAFGQEPHYSVAIGHVSGLDLTADLGHMTATLEPEFNLTIRVASRGIWATVCTEPRMYATVSYRGVSLANSATFTKHICVGPMEAVEHPIVARGAGVVMSRSILDSLAMDIHSGVPKFDLELRGPSPRNIVWQCGPRMVGDAAALQMECTYY